MAREPGGSLVSKLDAVLLKHFSLIFGVLALPFLWRVSRNIALELRFEDALIVLRYARNIAEGHGFVFNPGERVLGVTTPLHTLISAAYVWLGGEAAPAVQNVAGAVFLVLEAWLAARILQRTHPPVLGALAAILILTNLNFNYLYFGMETHLFAFLVLLAVDLFLRGRNVLTGIVLGLAFLTRYDAALLALLIGLARLASSRRPPAKLTAAFFAVVTPWLAFSYLYFGSILPQALAAKKDYYPVLGYIRFVFHYYQEYFSALAGVFTSSAAIRSAASWLFPLIAAAGVWSLARRAWQTLVLVAFAAGQVLTYAVLGPDPAFYWHYYLLNPVLTLLFLAGLYEIGRAAGNALTPARWRAGATTAAAALLLAAVAVAGWGLHRRLDYVYRLDPHSRQLFEVAGWLDERYDSATSLLQPSIGILGYGSRLRLIDHAGLVTPGLYYYDGSSHTPMMEVLRRFQPDLALVPEGAETVLAQQGYREIARFEDPATYLLYERPGPGTPSR